MAHSKNLLDIIALEKCEVPYTKKNQYIFSTIIILYIKKTPGIGAIVDPRAIV